MPEPLPAEGLDVRRSVDTMPVLFPAAVLLTAEDVLVNEDPLVPAAVPMLPDALLADEELVPIPLRFTGVRTEPSLRTV